MANNFIKYIAVVSSLAVMAGTLPVAFAEADGAEAAVYENIEPEVEFVEAAAERSDGSTQIAFTDFSDIGDVVGAGISLGTEAQTVPCDISDNVVMNINVGNRTTGGNTSTGWKVGTDPAGTDFGSNLYQQSGKYCNSNRGTSLSFKTSATAKKRVVLAFDYYAVNAGNNSAEIVFKDAAGTTLITLPVNASALKNNAWNRIEYIQETNGLLLVTVENEDGAHSFTSENGAPGTLPAIWFAQTEGSEANPSMGYIDNLGIYTGGATVYSINVGYNGENFSTDAEATIDYTTESEYALDVAATVNNAAVKAVSTKLTLDSTESQYITLSDNKLIVDSAIDEGSYKVVVTAVLADNEEVASTYTINFVVPPMSPDEILTLAMKKFNIDVTQSNVAAADDGTYISYGRFNLPNASGKAKLGEWTVEEQAEDGTWATAKNAYVDNRNRLVWKGAPKENYTIKLTGTLYYTYVDEAGATQTATETREFVVVAPDLAKSVFYNEDFSNFAVGNIVDLTNGSEQTKYLTEGMTFTCGTRTTGGSTEISVRIAEDATRGNYMIIETSNYQSADRAGAVVTLTRDTIAEKNAFTIETDILFSGATTTLQLTDANSNIVTIGAPTGQQNKWLKLELATIGSNTYVMFKDEDGNVLDYYIASGSIASLKTMQIPGNLGSVSLDNFQVTDQAYSIDYEAALAVAKNKLELDSEQAGLSKDKAGNYVATSDFSLPSAPDMTSIEWQAYCKPMASDNALWQESDFIKVSGNQAVINPTDDINSYAVKLVATISAQGVETTETKEFGMILPNPMDEINGILSSGYETVNSTDVNEAGKKITVDLKNAGLLKRDIVLPTTVSGYDNSSIKWTSSDEQHLSIGSDNIAKVMTQDFDTHDVTLTAVVTYTKGGITYSSAPQEFKLKVGFESSDVSSNDTTLGKYRVRYDAAYAENFDDVPSSTTSDIKLPTEGKFGSEITWTSDAPTVISNIGKVTRPSSNRNVTLSASIMSGAVSEGKDFKVSVSGKKASSGGGGGGGGGGSISSVGTTNNPSTGTLANDVKPSVVDPTVSGEDRTQQLTEEALQATDLFKDLSQAAWARAEINALATAGIINGKSETLFAPNDNVTRAEFAKMLMGAFNLASSGAFASSSFRDVSTSAWYFDSVETAYNLGIINGVSDTEFSPNANITRQDMAVMVMRAAKATSKVPEAVVESANFADSGSIADYAKEAVDTLQRAGIINGMTDTTFAPNGNATRAQAAKILYAFLNK